MARKLIAAIFFIVFSFFDCNPRKIKSCWLETKRVDFEIARMGVLPVLGAAGFNFANSTCSCRAGNSSVKNEANL